MIHFIIMEDITTVLDIDDTMNIVIDEMRFSKYQKKVTIISPYKAHHGHLVY